VATVAARIGGVMATQKRQEQSAQALAGVTSAEQKTKGRLIETRGHEEWKQRLEEDWQDYLEPVINFVPLFAKG